MASEKEPAILADLRELIYQLRNNRHPSKTIHRDYVAEKIEAIIARHEPELRRMARADREAQDARMVMPSDLFRKEQLRHVLRSVDRLCDAFMAPEIRMEELHELRSWVKAALAAKEGGNG